MKLTTVIIDDEKNNIKFVQKLLSMYCLDVEVVATASNVDDGIKVILDTKPDLLLLDIQLHDRDCFDLLACIDTTNICIVLISAHDHFGPKAVKYNILEYLLKPLSITDLVAATNSAKEVVQARMRNKQQHATFVSLPGNSELFIKNIEEITHLEALSNYTKFHISNGDTYITSRLLKEYETILPDTFVRAHRSFIVNLHYVDKFNKGNEFIALKDKTQIPLTDSGKKEVMRKITRL